jgi:hypothetical protein
MPVVTIPSGRIRRTGRCGRVRFMREMSVSDWQAHLLVRVEESGIAHLRDT